MSKKIASLAFLLFFALQLFAQNSARQTGYFIGRLIVPAAIIFLIYWFLIRKKKN